MQKGAFNTARFWIEALRFQFRNSSFWMVNELLKAKVSEVAS